MKANEYPDQIFLFKTSNEIVWADAHPRDIVPDTEWDEDDGAVEYLRLDAVTQALIKVGQRSKENALAVIQISKVIEDLRNGAD